MALHTSATSAEFNSKVASLGILGNRSPAFMEFECLGAPGMSGCRVVERTSVGCIRTVFVTAKTDTRQSSLQR